MYGGRTPTASPHKIEITEILTYNEATSEYSDPLPGPVAESVLVGNTCKGALKQIEYVVQFQPKAEGPDSLNSHLEIVDKVLARIVIGDVESTSPSE